MPELLANIRCLHLEAEPQSQLFLATETLMKTIISSYREKAFGNGHRPGLKMAWLLRSAYIAHGVGLLKAVVDATPGWNQGGRIGTETARVKTFDRAVWYLQMAGDNVVEFVFNDSVGLERDGCAIRELFMGPTPDSTMAQLLPFMA